MIKEFGKDKPYIGDEDNFQISTVPIFAHHFKAYEYFHTPNGGRRNKREAAKLKRMGVKKGVSDWVVLNPNEKHHGLVIELKAAKRVRKELKRGIEYQVVYGKIYDHQIEFLEQMEANGYFACIAWNLSEVRKIIENYKNNKL